MQLPTICDMSANFGAVCVAECDYRRVAATVATEATRGVATDATGAVIVRA